MKKFLFLSLSILFVGTSFPAIAECKHCIHAKNHDMHAGHNMAAPMQNMAKSKKTKADRALYDVSIKMHHAMDVALIDTADADFLRTMIPHHQGAIDMADVLLKYGTDEKAANFAKLIRRVQVGEIAWMKRLLGRMDQPLNAKTGGGAMEASADTPKKKELLHIHHSMHQKMDVVLTGNADADFVRAMIPHHQGAIDMAFWVLRHGRNDDVKDLARDIIKAQQAEIAWMKNWLEKRDIK